MAKFYTKAGWLTPFAMACGYRHVANNGNLIFESGNWELGLYAISNYSNSYDRKYETFNSIKDARKRFKELAGTLSYRFESSPYVNMRVIA